MNLTGPADRFGQRSPWVELFNASASPISLQAYSLGASYTNTDGWLFPDDAVIGPGEFRLVWLDANASQSIASEWHSNFRPTAGNGTLVLRRQSGSELQVVDYLEYAGLADGHSIGWASDGRPGERVAFPLPTPLEPNAGAASASIFINEWMAANSQSIADPADGRSDDWVELFNSGAAPVDLGGYSLSDSTAEPRKLVFPLGTIIPAKGFLLVWVDGEPEQTSPGGAVHANFRLSADGEMIILSAPDGSRLDFVSFGQQAQDVAEGRWPDGSISDPRRLTRPTPAAANVWIGEILLGAFQLNANGQIEASWFSAPGQQFQVQFKDDLSDPLWTDLGQPLVAAGTEMRAAFGGPTNAQRFFRVVLAGP